MARSSWIELLRARLFRTRGRSGLVACGVAVMVVLGTTGFVLGRANTALHLRVSLGEAWLSTTGRGSVSLVDGLTGKSSAELLLRGAAGHYLEVSQSGGQVLILDTRTHKLFRINASQLALGSGTATSAGSVVVAGVAATYLVNYQSATVQRIDPVTLAPLGPLVHVPGQLGRTAVVDRNGTLWVAVISSGSVVPVNGGGLGQAIHVGADGADLVLTTADGEPIAVNRSAGRINALTLDGAGSGITLPVDVGGKDSAGSGGLLVPVSSESGTLPIVDPGSSPTLVLVDLNRGSTRTIPLGAAVKGHRLGDPVQAGPRVFIPDYTTGSVLEYNTAKGGAATSIPVIGHRGVFQAVVIDGIAYFNDPNGNTAVVVTPSGQVLHVRKTGGGVPTAHPSAPPKPGPAPNPSGSSTASPGPRHHRPPHHGPGHHGPGHHGPGRHHPTPSPRPGPHSPSPPPSSSSPSPSSPSSSSSSPSPSPSPSPSSPSSSSPSPSPSSPSPSPSSSPPPPPPPLAPVGAQATSGAGFVDVSWQAPKSGGPVSSYQVSVSPPGPGVQSPTSATSVRVTGLSCGTVYSFTVASVGAGGERVPAAPVTARPCVPPGSPQGLSAAVSSQQIKLTWAAPASTGGGQVTYTASWGGGSQPGITGTSFTISGLANFQTYSVTVTATSAAGAGADATTSVNLSPGQTWGYHLYNNGLYTLHVRAGPSVGSGSLGTFPVGSAAGVQVICQVSGGFYTDPTGSPSGNIWDRIQYGAGVGYVADGYVSTPNSMANTFSPPIWEC